MLSEYITSLADVSFHIVAYMYARFQYSGKNPMRFAVFLAYFCAVFGPPLHPPPIHLLEWTFKIRCWSKWALKQGSSLTWRIIASGQLQWPFFLTTTVRWGTLNQSLATSPFVSFIPFDSIKSYNDRPSLDQQKKMSEVLSTFLSDHEATSADKEN